MVLFAELDVSVSVLHSGTHWRCLALRGCHRNANDADDDSHDADYECNQRHPPSVVDVTLLAAARRRRSGGTKLLHELIQSRHRRLDRPERRRIRFLLLQLAERVLAEGTALARDHVVELAEPRLRRVGRLERPLRRASGQLDKIDSGLSDLFHLVRDRKEVVVREQCLAHVADDVRKEGFQQSAGLAVARLVRAHVDVGDGNDRPRELARHVVERHGREVGGRIRRQHTGLQRGRRRSLDTSAGDRLRGRLERSVEVVDGNFADAVVVAVAGVDVTDAVVLTGDSVAHAAHALRREGATRPFDRRAHLRRRPLRGTRLIQVRGDAGGR
mmetsp:Transcript_1913/g.5692  ORF Transcript_1913/g.5692 Transcript_1913/m.5692 type:complete len:329 (+) Transcript_1913:273-1259(+)